MPQFTPLFDWIIELHGLTTAAVYGAIWRYCQMPGGVCFASADKIAARAGLKLRATNDKIKFLVEEGIIEDLTPDLRNRPHRYQLNAMHEMHSTMHLMHTHYAPNAYEDTLKTHNKNGRVSQSEHDERNVITR